MQGLNVLHLLEEIFIISVFRYEKELTHPIKSLLGGELARAMLIQVNI